MGCKGKAWQYGEKLLNWQCCSTVRARQRWNNEGMTAIRIYLLATACVSSCGACQPPPSAR